MLWREPFPFEMFFQAKPCFILTPSESAFVMYFAGLQLPHYFIAVHSWLIQLVLCNRIGAQCALYLPALVACFSSLLAVTVWVYKPFWPPVYQGVSNALGITVNASCFLVRKWALVSNFGISFFFFCRNFAFLFTTGVSCGCTPMHITHFCGLF